MRQLNITKKFTDRKTDSVDRYLNEVARIDMITPEEEIELARKIQQGDERALEKLTKANLRFVISVAKQYQGNGMSLADLINEGNLGLIKAAKRFDETRGFKFISYAVWWIRQSILLGLAEHSRLVRLPQNQLNRHSKIKQARIRLEQDFQREPSSAELSKELEWSDKEIERSMRHAQRKISLDAPTIEGGDDDRSLMDTMVSEKSSSPEDGMMYQSLQKEVHRVLARLNQRERQIICAYFGIGYDEPRTLGEIANQLDLTKERVRQLKFRALRRLQKTYSTDVLKQYLG